MWRLPDDDSQPVITAAEQIHSAHRMCHFKLPKNGDPVLYEQGVGISD